MRSGRKIVNASRAGLLMLGAAALAAALLAPAEGAAASYQVLYKFCSQSHCLDGVSPSASLIIDEAGNLFGTTREGGFQNGGVVFKLASDGTETVLHDFCSSSGCADGRRPQASLIIDGYGNLYGTTVYGGTSGNGVVFGLFRTPPPFEEYRYRILYSFCAQSGCADGALPVAGLAADTAGNLYGTTWVGGTAGAGVVFKLAPDGTETVLYNFCSQDGCADGAYPLASLIIDGAGNLYGTTRGGGFQNEGVVFNLTPDGTETVLYSFCGRIVCADGAYPEAGLIIDGGGNLYGTTYSGGFGQQGVAFELAPDGTETVLWNFCALSQCADGAQPAGGLIMDAAGNLYGTTYGGGGGTFDHGGVVFKLASDGTETILYSFCSQSNCADGVLAEAGLIMDAAGNLYGTTSEGGTAGDGVVFMVVP
jgi:uncharacterized repeat protein (TIGR03803 family)